MKLVLPVLAGLFAVASMVLGFVGLFGGQAISPFAAVGLLIAVALLALFLFLRQRDAAGK